MNSSSLRRQLVLPYVLLVMFVSAAIGWVSYRAGEESVNSLGERVVLGLLDRMGNAIERQLAGALTALNAMQPDGRELPRLQAFPSDLARIEKRLWISTGLSSALTNYVYYVSMDGGFLGVRRVNSDLVEVMVRRQADGVATVYAASEGGDRTHILRTEAVDSGRAAWFAKVAGAHRPVWSSVFQDLASGEPTISMAKGVPGRDGKPVGVVATDVTLKTLTDFMRGLTVSANGVAFVVDDSGGMIATSGAEMPFRMSERGPQRLRADEMRTPVLREAYALVDQWKRDGMLEAGQRRTARVGALEIAAARIADTYGLDWVTVVAVPRSDFMEGVTRSVLQATFIALVCVVIALVLGLSVLNRVLRDIGVLSDAARRVGDGEPLPKLDISRRDELGLLARSFSEMEHNLRIDKLTAVFNRASLTAQIARLRHQLQQSPHEHTAFALLFIDLDHFKKINDQYGHEAGDRVLVAVAARLKESVRTSDVVARYGGDEFVVLLKGVTDVQDVLATLEKLRSVVEQPVSLEQAEVSVGASVGWAVFPEDGKDVDKLLKIADGRMYATKRSRRL